MGATGARSEKAENAGKVCPTAAVPPAASLGVSCTSRSLRLASRRQDRLSSFQTCP